VPFFHPRDVVVLISRPFARSRSRSRSRARDRVLLVLVVSRARLALVRFARRANDRRRTTDDERVE
jgi:hypothetical protein